MLEVKKIFTSLFLSFTFFIVTAQEEKLPSYFSSTSFSILNKSVHFEQIQNFKSNNVVNREGIISLQQIGDSNNANIQNKLAIGIHNVQQKGNLNHYEFLNYNNGMSINLGVLQLGNENTLKIIGSNALTRNMSIIQFGGAKMEILSY